MNIKKEAIYNKDHHIMIDEDGKVHIKISEGRVRPFLSEIFKKKVWNMMKRNQPLAKWGMT
ncbi:hypothetical protein A4G20_05195 [Pasteurellaceae bacterium RH1A]|nr:hypothetical protein A4G20_05195 [Pasteurellaceae bacterium RH1A]